MPISRLISQFCLVNKNKFKESQQSEVFQIVSRNLYCPKTKYADPENLRENSKSFMGRNQYGNSFRICPLDINNNILDTEKAKSSLIKNNFWHLLTTVHVLSRSEYNMSK